jgi:hypothetical protein
VGTWAVYREREEEMTVVAIVAIVVIALIVLAFAVVLATEVSHRRELRQLQQRS